jgi:hypothetical protein
MKIVKGNGDDPQFSFTFLKGMRKTTDVLRKGSQPPSLQFSSSRARGMNTNPYIWQACVLIAPRSELILTLKLLVKMCKRVYKVRNLLDKQLSRYRRPSNIVLARRVTSYLLKYIYIKTIAAYVYNEYFYRCFLFFKSVSISQPAYRIFKLVGLKRWLINVTGISYCFIIQKFRKIR